MATLSAKGDLLEPYRAIAGDGAKIDDDGYLWLLGRSMTS